MPYFNSVSKKYKPNVRIFRLYTQAKAAQVAQG